MTGLLLGIAFVAYVGISVYTAWQRSVNSDSTDTDGEFIINILKSLAKFFIPYLAVCVAVRLLWLGVAIGVVYGIYYLLTNKH